jgi:hypothetical protein
VEQSISEREVWWRQNDQCPRFVLVTCPAMQKLSVEVCYRQSSTFLHPASGTDGAARVSSLPRPKRGGGGRHRCCVCVAGKVDGIARVIVLLGPGLLCWWLIVFRFMTPVGLRNDEEFAAGYTTFVMQFGTFRSGGRHWQNLSWDYRGTWVMNEHGAVVSGPDRGFDAPGYYPSPNNQGTYELWTGTTWSGHFRPAPAL